MLLYVMLCYVILFYFISSYFVLCFVTLINFFSCYFILLCVPIFVPFHNFSTHHRDDFVIFTYFLVFTCYNFDKFLIFC